MLGVTATSLQPPRLMSNVIRTQAYLLKMGVNDGNFVRRMNNFLNEISLGH